MQEEYSDERPEQVSRQEHGSDEAPGRSAWRAFWIRRLAQTQSRRFVIELLCLTVVIAAWEIAGAWSASGFGHSRHRFGPRPAQGHTTALKAVRPRRHRPQGQQPGTASAPQAADANTQALISDFDAQVAKLQEQLKAQKQSEGR